MQIFEQGIVKKMIFNGVFLKNRHKKNPRRSRRTPRMDDRATKLSYSTDSILNTLTNLYHLLHLDIRAKPLSYHAEYGVLLFFHINLVELLHCRKVQKYSYTLLPH